MQKTGEDKPQKMLAAVAHEIRNPLTLIQSYLQLIRAQNPQIGSSVYWGIVESELRHLNSILSDLSLCQNGMRVKKELTPMSDWMRAYIKTIQPVFEGCPDISLNTEIPADLPLMPVDGDRLRQLMDNLVRNALEAIEQKKKALSETAAAASESEDNTGDAVVSKPEADAGGPAAAVSEPEADAGGTAATVSEPAVDIGDAVVLKSPENKKTDSVTLSVYMEEDDLCINVADTGCGIGKERRDSLFEPFVTDKEQGTGLGLPICRNIARAHGGEVSLFGSSFGKTRFQVRLPVKSLR